MKTNIFISVALWLGVIASSAVLFSQWHEQEALREKIAALPKSTIATSKVEATHRGPEPSPAHPDKTTQADAIDGQASLRDLTTATRERLSRLGRGHWSDVFAGMQESIDALSAEQLLALLSGDPGMTYATENEGAHVSDDVLVDAQYRLTAARRLAKIDPVAFLLLTEKVPSRAKPDERSPLDGLTNEITQSLQRWSGVDAGTAVTWGKTNEGRLPLGINHAHMALEAIARTDMTSAFAMARQQGFDLTNADGYLSRAASTPAAVDAFMAEIKKMQDAAPNGFVVGANQFYGDFAAMLGNAQGFDAARAFAEKWAAPLEWRDSVGLEAVKAALGRSAPDDAALAAADWFVQFAPDSRRRDAMERLINHWADEDYAQAARWLERHASDPWHDAGLAALCRKIAPFDPAASAELAAGITDAASREKAGVSPAAR